MKVFVTGATGFIGKQVCRTLHQHGHEIVALVRTPAKAANLPPGTEVLRGDLNTLKDTKFVIPKCDAVIHLAATLNGKSDAEYTLINFEGVKNLVACLERQKWRTNHLLFASSLAAGGPTFREARVEEMEDKPIESYGKSKLQAEQFLQTLDIPTTSFRPPMVIGPGDEGTFPLYEMGKKGLAFRPMGKPQVVSFVDVEDLAEAILCMLQKPAKAGEHRVYYVSHYNKVTTVQLFKTIGKEMGQIMLIFSIPKFMLKTASLVMTGLAGILPVDNKLDARQYKQITAGEFSCSSVKLQKEMGWKPKYNLQEAIAKAVAGYRAIGWL